MIAVVILPIVSFM